MCKYISFVRDISQHSPPLFNQQTWASNKRKAEILEEDVESLLYARKRANLSEACSSGLSSISTTVWTHSIVISKRQHSVISRLKAHGLSILFNQNACFKHQPWAISCKYYSLSPHTFCHSHLNRSHWYPTNARLKPKIWEGESTSVLSYA